EDRPVMPLRAAAARGLAAAGRLAGSGGLAAAGTGALLAILAEPLIYHTPSSPHRFARASWPSGTGQGRCGAGAGQVGAGPGRSDLRLPSSSADFCGPHPRRIPANADVCDPVLVEC